MKLMTYNVQNDMKKASKDKVDTIVTFIENEDPDIIGLQELTKSLKLELQKRLPRYKFLGRSRFTNGLVFDEFNCLLVRRTIQVFETNTYSLGRNPDKVMSKNFLSAFPRIFTSAVVLLNNRKIKIINTHLDHLFTRTKKYQLRVIAELLENNDYPIIIMGDLNMHPGNDNLIKFTQKLNLHDNSMNMGRTCKNSESDKPIDYILTNEAFSIKNKKKHTDITVSDHYPITMEVDIESI